MAENKRFKYVSFVTEVVTARYPKLSAPDTEGEYADGKYKTEAIADEDYTSHFQRSIQDVADEYFAGKENVHVPWKEAAPSFVLWVLWLLGKREVRGA